MSIGPRNCNKRRNEKNWQICS